MFDHCLYFNTTALGRQLERLWTQAFKPLDLTPPQAFLLRAVLAQPGLLQHELAELMTISRPTATRALDGLAEKGLIERRVSPVDRRESAIHPTPKATAIRAKLEQASGGVTAQLKAVLGSEPFTDTVARLKHIRTALNE
jgi:DNA-binding MarR family transcriptional regulator